MSFKKDDVLEVLERDNNGWWLVKNNGEEGWAPSNYLEEIVRQKVDAPPPIPQRSPATRPAQSNTNAVTSNQANFPPAITASDGAASRRKPPVTSHVNLIDSSVNRGVSIQASGAVATKPPIPAKPKPVPPPIANKPVVPKNFDKSTGSTIQRKPAQLQGGSAPGQLDLAAAVSISQNYAECDYDKTCSLQKGHSILHRTSNTRTFKIDCFVQ